MRSLKRLGLSFLAVSGCIAAHAAGFSFMPLGPAGTFSLSPRAISADGLSIAGRAASNDVTRFPAFLWSPTSGTTFLTANSTTLGLTPRAVANGGMVVGTYDTGGAFTWTSLGGLQGFGSKVIGERPFPSAVTPNGARIVGWSGLTPKAFYWTAAKGFQTLTVYPESLVYAVSNSGGYMVGAAYQAGSAQAFYWRGGTSVGLLGFLKGDTASVALAVSGDGTTICGGSNLPAKSLQHGFYWRAATGMVGLGSLDSSLDSLAECCNMDGSFIAGESDGIAFIWTKGIGMVNLAQFLTAYGVQGLAGWRLTGVQGMSQDGTVLYGTADTPLGAGIGFVATLPPIVPIHDDYATTQGVTLVTPAGKGVLSNDVNAGGATTSIQKLPTHGTVTLQSNGLFTYVPDPAYTGTDYFRYVARKGAYTSPGTTVTITIS